MDNHALALPSKSVLNCIPGKSVTAGLNKS